MTRWLCRTLVAAAVATTASGCTLYFGGDDDDCLWEGAAEAAGLRNPQTNQCEFIGGGPNCGDAVPAGAAEDSFGAPAPVDWAQCFTACEGLDELSCFAAPECRATYLQTDPSAPGFRTFSGCVGIAPSGPAAPGEACQGLDGYGCSRHNDCVAIYSGEDRPDDGYSGTGVFVACEPEPITQGCYANEDCPTGFECTVSQGDCQPPPGCGGGGVDCPAVCFGQCVPSGGSCAAIDCGPGFHCEEVCSDTGTGSDGSGAEDAPVGPGTCTATCVPDETFCPLECPPNSVCVEVCPPCGYPGDPACGQPCHFECQLVQPGVCEGFECGPDAHCEERCHPCDPLPDGSGCESACEPFCVPNPPTTCEDTFCAPGSHCELQCAADPSLPPGMMDECTATCVPDAGAGCAAIDCGPGTHCVESCLPMPCDDPAGCPELCRGECVPDDPGTCAEADCAMPPPVCPPGTQPGVSGGCYTGYCIPADHCGGTPTRCEELDSEFACVSQPSCAPIYTGTCTPNPDGTWTCIDTVFARCETRAVPF